MTIRPSTLPCPQHHGWEKPYSFVRGTMTGTTFGIGLALALNMLRGFTPTDARTLMSLAVLFLLTLLVVHVQFFDRSPLRNFVP